MAKPESGLLDELLPPDVLADIKAKRIKRGKADLSDLLGEERPKPPPIEVLHAISVLFYVQENTCRCGAVSEIPLGLVAMHGIKRHGRRCDDKIGVALAEPNEFPELPREREVHRSNSIVCAQCVDTARFLPRVTPTAYSPPVPGTPAWQDQFGFGSAQEIHEREEKLHRREERERRLEALADDAVLTRNYGFMADSVKESETNEITQPEDTE